ncbi:MAG: hypothetical protein ACYC7A_07685 [Thermoanaerobaculia bacterium]
MTCIRPFALGALLLSAISCGSLPWTKQTAKTTLVFDFLRGQPVVTAGMGGVEGQFVVGSAHPHTLVHEPGSGGVVSLGPRTTVTIEPRVAPLQTGADGILAMDVWRQTGTLALDYARGVVTLGGNASFGDASSERFESVPSVSLLVDRVPMRAVVDTSYPGGLVLPVSASTSLDSSSAVIELNGIRTEVPVQRAEVPGPRIGNALLRRYLVMIDFRKRLVALWPDARLLRRRNTNASSDAGKVNPAAAVVGNRERAANAIGFD